MKARARFVTLDLLRGVAAIPIVYNHTARMFGKSRLAVQSPIAVDFLFLLSGFVIAHAYEHRLDAGWSTWGFFRSRVIRLYPVYLVGLLSGLMFFLLQTCFGGTHFPVSTLLSVLALGLFLLPIPPMPLLASAPKGMYPLNAPTWSLCGQLLANLFHGWFLRKRSTIFLGIMTGALSMGLLLMAVRNGTMGMGTDRPYYFYGFLRVLFAYSTGMLIHRVWNSGRWRMSAPPMLLVLLFLACLYVPTVTRHAGLYECAEVTFVFPLLILTGANAAIKGRLASAAEWLGSISYPLYILHLSFFALFEQVWLHVTRHPIEKDAPWGAVTCFLLLLPTAKWVGSRYDPQARRVLGTRIWRLPQPALKSAPLVLVVATEGA